MPYKLFPKGFMSELYCCDTRDIVEYKSEEFDNIRNGSHNRQCVTAALSKRYESNTLREISH